MKGRSMGGHEGGLMQATPMAWLADEFFQSYVCWREESTAARGAYERWQVAEGPDQALAFAAYRAALDREEHAARMLREHSERIATR